MISKNLLTISSKKQDLFEKMSDVLPIFVYQNFKNSEVSIVLNNKNIIFSLNTLKKHLHYQYNLLSCISGVDLLKKRYRFMISYDLLSITYNSRIRVKVFVNEYDYVFSSTEVFVSANWWEREVWDLFGIYFENHPDLRRILTDYGFEGYPLRKDFPLFGFRELRYDSTQRSILYEPVVLSQEFRNFSYQNSW